MVRDGDFVSIDATPGVARIALEVGDGELARRKAATLAPGLRCLGGVLEKYAAVVAAKGAVTHSGGVMWNEDEI